MEKKEDAIGNAEWEGKEKQGKQQPPLLLLPPRLHPPRPALLGKI